MENGAAVLCAPLQQLKNEHMTLRKTMDCFYELTEEIEYASGPDIFPCSPTCMNRFYYFTDMLKAHSDREEEGLFPMMERHLGEADKTIEWMEAEHEKAERLLQRFITEANQNQTETSQDENDIQSITVYVAQAYDILIQHFAKEEKTLFPLAEQHLSVEEKKELEQY